MDREKLLKAKIPCAETGIECKHTFCSICEPAFHCGVNAYIKDDELIKVEGIEGFPMSNGKLCPKGMASRQYVYREDRLTTPLKRVTPHGGEGEFEPISWDEAYEIIAEKLGDLKEKYGANSVAFYVGYAKWYRAMLHRFAYSYGSVNFGTESSTCNTACDSAFKDVTGSLGTGDMGNSKCHILWGRNPAYSTYVQMRPFYAAKARGLKVIVIDPRETPSASKWADLHLKIKPGTDAALALGMAKIIIDNNWHDSEFIEKHVHGFEEYRKEIDKYDLATVAEITGLDPELIMKATEMYADGPSSISLSAAAIVHHINGYQTFKSIISLMGISGNYDVAGGNIPQGETFAYRWAGFTTAEHEYYASMEPKEHAPMVGDLRFPLWKYFKGEAQFTDIVRHAETAKPYPLKAMMGFGLNHRMFPQPHKVMEMLDNMEFVVSAELFMTDVCKHSDIILPVCTSFEREEFKVYPGGKCWYIEPVIPPVGESRSDVQIVTELANVMNLDDELLKKGYRVFVEYCLKDCKLNLEDCMGVDMPVMSPDVKPYEPRKYTEQGYNTPSGKFELYSETIAGLKNDPWYAETVELFGEPELSPVPTWDNPYDNDKAEEYPFVLSSGGRLPYALHSRSQEIPWLRDFHPVIRVDMNDEDAAAMGIELNDPVEVRNDHGVMQGIANPTAKHLPGTVQIYHGRREADPNELLGLDHLDPYSGFPGYNCIRVALKKIEG